MSKSKDEKDILLKDWLDYNYKLIDGKPFKMSKIYKSVEELLKEHPHIIFHNANLTDDDISRLLGLSKTIKTSLSNIYDNKTISLLEEVMIQNSILDENKKAIKTKKGYKGRVASFCKAILLLDRLNLTSQKKLVSLLNDKYSFELRTRSFHSTNKNSSKDVAKFASHLHAIFKSAE